MYFSIKAPTTFSWISTEREKQIVLRANRFKRVRSVRLLRSMCWVNILPVRCLSSAPPAIAAPVVAGDHDDGEGLK